MTVTACRAPGYSGPVARPRPRYLRPRTVEEALELKQTHEGSRYISGGTDLIIRMKDGFENPQALISVRNIPDLREVVVTTDLIRIGAALPVSDLLAHSELMRRLPVLGLALARLGSLQIRNAATVGGNLVNAIPCADSAPPLLVTEARVEVRQGHDGETREIPLDQFFTGPRETVLEPHDLVTAVVLEHPAAVARATFLKKTRVAMDLALSSLAALVELDGATCRKARLAAGSVAPTPLRLPQVERILEGTDLSDEVVASAAAAARDAISPIDDVRGSADYRRHIVGIQVKRALTEIREEAP